MEPLDFRKAAWAVLACSFLAGILGSAVGAGVLMWLAQR